MLAKIWWLCMPTSFLKVSVPFHSCGILSPVTVWLLGRDSNCLIINAMDLKSLEWSDWLQSLATTNGSHLAVYQLFISLFSLCVLTLATFQEFFSLPALLALVLVIWFCSWQVQFVIAVSSWLISLFQLFHGRLQVYSVVFSDIWAVLCTNWQSHDLWSSYGSNCMRLSAFPFSCLV